MADHYRKRKGKDTWHFCSNCTNWPKHPDDFDVSYQKPTTGEFCNECKAKKADGNCQ